MDYKRLFEASPGLVLVLRPDLTISGVTDSYLRATKTVREKIVGKGLFEVFPDNPSDKTATGTRNLRESLLRVIAHKKPDTMAIQKYDIRRPRDEGGGFEERHWSPMNAPVLGPDGRLEYILHTVEDVTAFVRLVELERVGQKRNAVPGTDQVASTSDERFKHLSEAVQDYCIFMLDRKGHVISWNKGAERLKGYRATEIIGRSFATFFTAEDVLSGLPKRLLSRASSRGRAVDQRWSVRKDGTRFLARALITPLREKNGRVRGFSHITRDISEGERARFKMDVSERILRAEEIERRRVARELHDSVNQLLASAKFRLQAAEDRLPRAQTSAIVEIDQALRIIEDAIHEVRRISHDMRPAVLEDLGLAAALRSACADFKARTGARVSLECSGLPRRLEARMEMACYRIIQESLNNAAKHARARRVSIALARRGRWLKLRVADDGAGFAIARKGASGGGLTNMRERAEFHGGRFELRSAPARGTTILVDLPFPGPR